MLKPVDPQNGYRLVTIMRGDQNKMLNDSIKRSLRRDPVSHLRRIGDKPHATDVSIFSRFQLATILLDI